MKLLTALDPINSVAWCFPPVSTKSLSILLALWVNRRQRSVSYLLTLGMGSGHCSALQFYKKNPWILILPLVVASNTCKKKKKPKTQWV